MEDKKQVFALDIGTRSVVGLIAEKKGEHLILQHIISKEHSARAMIDGQIHDITETARVVRDIKSQLQQQAGIELEEAAVAAAGRALITVKASYTKRFSPRREVTRQDVKELELTGVREAMNQLKSKDKTGEYHCVGYSVTHYKLEGQVIGNLVGQKGREISAEIVATFLPRVVVDSLLTVLDKAELKLKSLTLEPIAASHVVVPPNMRKINIALVDIGAGTSDIAISKDGSITAYGMVPMAGDEVTECLSEKFLLDFDTAERVKRELNKKQEVTFTDILGMEYTLETKEIIRNIMESIDTITKNIAKTIIELNGKLPQGVLCVGGGSLTPGLCQRLASHLGIPSNRVGVKHGGHITNLKFSSEMDKPIEVNTPLLVTPIGIAASSFDNPGLGIIRIVLNDEPLQLFEFTKPTVFDALSQKDIKTAEIFGKPGMALTFTVDNKLKVVKGKPGKPAKIKVNGQKASLETPLKNGDVLTFTPGSKGEDGKLTVKELLQEVTPAKITINGREISIEPETLINGEKAQGNQDIPDGAKIEIRNKNLILSDVLKHISLNKNHHGGVLVTKINGKKAEFVSPVKNGDSVEIYWHNPRASSQKGSVL